MKFDLPAGRQGRGESGEEDIFVYVDRVREVKSEYVELGKTF